MGSFSFNSSIAQGSERVAKKWIARYKENNLLYALKFIDKQKIRKFNGENSILTEKDVLECVYHY